MSVVFCVECGEPLNEAVAFSVAYGGPAVCGPCIDKRLMRTAITCGQESRVVGGSYEMTTPNLKSVDEYNAERRRIREENNRKARLTGVACPKCGKELEWETGIFAQLAICPSSITFLARCSDCNLSVRLER